MNTKYPPEAATVLLVSVNALRKNRAQTGEQDLEATWDIDERILGAEPGIFRKYALKMG